MNNKGPFNIALWLVLLLAPLSSFGVTAEYTLPDSLQELNFWDNSGKFIGSMEAAACPPLSLLEIIPESGLADGLDIYRIKLTLPVGGIPRSGGVSFGFPSTFGLNRVGEVEYSDDYEGKDLEINHIYVNHNILIILFKHGNSPPAGTVITFTVSSIKNPTEAGEYQAAGLIFNKRFKVVSGPNLSEKFIIFPDHPISLTISPSEALTLLAGNTQLFTAVAKDRYGNEVTGLDIIWSLSPEYDEIGTISDGYFLATTSDIGKVVAVYDDLKAVSGFITVVPGIMDHFLLTYDVSATPAGESLLSPVTVAVYDRYGNLKTDYNGSIYFISSDAGADLYYNESKRYDFIPLDSGRHSFDGGLFTLYTVGSQNISVTDGIHSAAGDFFSVTPGKIASFYLVTIASSPILAGSPITTRIRGAVDRFGNATGGTVHVSVVDGGISPGGFRPNLSDIIVAEGSGEAIQYLYATGRAVIRYAADTVIRESFLLIEPAVAGDISAAIQPAQFIGNSLFGPATITAYDIYGNLKTDFDATENPVNLSVDKGSLNRNRLDEVTDFVDGVADLSIKNILYTGETGVVKFSASLGGSRMTSVDLIFNGLVFEMASLPDSIFAGQKIFISADVSNNGNLTPLDPAKFNNYFRSCLDDCYISTSIPPVAPGQHSGFELATGSDLLAPNTQDTLRVELESTYLFNGSPVNTVCTKLVPIKIVPQLSADYVPGSISPDTILSPSIIDSLIMRIRLNRDLSTLDLRLGIYLYIDPGDGKWSAIYEESVNDGTPVTGKTVTLSMLNVNMPDFAASGEYSEGPKGVKAIIFLTDHNGGFFWKDTLNLSDSLHILFSSRIAYKPGTLSPTAISAGIRQAFEFDLNLYGNTTVAIDASRSQFQLLYGSNIIAASLSEYPQVLEAGANHLVTGELDIPAGLAGKELTPRLILSGRELYRNRTDTLSFGDEIVTVSNLQQIKIKSTELVTVNPPFVNYNQQFAIRVYLQNLSNTAINDVLVFITSESGLDTLGMSSSQTVPAGGDFGVDISMVADSVSVPIKIYKSSMAAPGAAVLPPDDNTAAVTIQSPAQIELVYTVTGPYNNYLDFGQLFTIGVQLKNRGEALASAGEISLSTGNLDFGIPNPSSMILDIDSTAQWSLTAPSVTAEANLRLTLAGIPIDKNTGSPALVKTGETYILLDIESSEAELQVAGTVSSTPLIIEGTSRELFTLEVKSNTVNTLNIMGLKTIDIRLDDRKDNIIDPGLILDPDSSGFYLGVKRLTTAEISDNVLHLNFADFILNPKEERNILFRAKFRDNISIKGFGINIENDDIRAVFVSGPRAGQAVTVRGKYDSDFRISGNFTVTPYSTGQSLMIRNNPFNPETDKAEIAYNLETDAPVSMKIYTLTGEIVYETGFAQGAEGGSMGSNYVSWNGKNAEGKTVLNGVYIVVLRNERSGQTFKIKLAVVK